MKNPTSTLTLLIFCALLTGCSAQYAKLDGRWSYVAWDEGRGRTVTPVKGADATSFRQLEDADYAKDMSSVYKEGQKIDDADPATFTHISDVFWRDAHGVYFDGKKVVGADPVSFRPLPIKPWSKDSVHCFRGPLVVPSSDPITFVPINFYWAKDANHFYAYGFKDVLIVPCDYASMMMLNAEYAKDKQHVFWLGIEIIGADAATFEIISETLAKDKFRRYSGPEEYWMDKKKRESQ